MEYLTALVGPFVLLLVENFFPYPYLVEEIFKFFLAKNAKTTKTAVLLGLLFSISESIFYLFNQTYQISISHNIIRFLTVTPMHITTILVMQYFLKKKGLWPLGLLLATIIHYAFNILGTV